MGAKGARCFFSDENDELDEAATLAFFKHVLIWASVRAGVDGAVLTFAFIFAALFSSNRSWKGFKLWKLGVALLSALFLTILRRHGSSDAYDLNEEKDDDVFDSFSEIVDDLLSVWLVATSAALWSASATVNESTLKEPAADEDAECCEKKLDELSEEFLCVCAFISRVCAAKMCSRSMGVTFLDSVKRLSRSLAVSSTPIMKASFRFSLSTNSARNLKI